MPFLLLFCWRSFSTEESVCVPGTQSKEAVFPARRILVQGGGTNPVWFRGNNRMNNKIRTDNYPEKQTTT